jgi:Flp pilus assembly protein TadD
MVASNLFAKFGWKVASKELPMSQAQVKSHYHEGLNLKRRGNYGLALVQFKLAVAGNKNFAEAYLQMGRIHAELNDSRRSRKALTQALQIDPSLVEAHVELGKLHDKNGDFIQAIKVFMKAIQLRPDDVELRNGLGAVYFNMGAYPEAIKAYNQAISIKPSDVRAYFGLGLVYIDLEQNDGVSDIARKLSGLGRHDLAAQLIEKFKRDRGALQGDGHPKTLVR